VNQPPADSRSPDERLVDRLTHIIDDPNTESAVVVHAIRLRASKQIKGLEVKIEFARNKKLVDELTEGIVQDFMRECPGLSEEKAREIENDVSRAIQQARAKGRTFKSTLNDLLHGIPRKRLTLDECDAITDEVLARHGLRYRDERTRLEPLPAAPPSRPVPVQKPPEPHWEILAREREREFPYVRNGLVELPDPEFAAPPPEPDLATLIPERIGVGEMHQAVIAPAHFPDGSFPMPGAEFRKFVRSKAK